MIEGRKTLRTMLLLVSIVALVLMSACGSTSDSSSGDSNNEDKEKDKQADKKEKIVFSDLGWNSIRFHNQVAATILEEGYGYQTKVTTASMSIGLKGLQNGDIDVTMEIWGSKMGDAYEKALDDGKVKELGVNFGDTVRAYFVPTYMIEGDEERGIEPMAPDLESVKDLPKYKDLFKKSSGDNKGEIIGAPSMWGAFEPLQQKMKAYDLKDSFKYVDPGSGTALNVSLTKAYEAGEPWVGYAYSPSWVLGKYDLTRLKEPEYNEEKWNKNYGTAFPPEDIPIAINAKLEKSAPDAVKFLKKYKTNEKLTQEALVYMNDNEADAKKAATWWMNKHTDVWTEWVPDDVAKKVKKAIK